MDLEKELARLATRTPTAVVADILRDIDHDCGPDSHSGLAALIARALAAAERLDMADFVGIVRDAHKLRIALREQQREVARKIQSNGFRAHLQTLAAHFGGAEIDHVAAMLQLGETIESADAEGVVTNQRRISRDEIRAFGRPTSWRRDDTWAKYYG